MGVGGPVAGRGGAGGRALGGLAGPGGRGRSRGCFRRGGCWALVGEQALFYARRIPDAIAGPFIEVATVFGRSPWLGVVATAGAIAVTAVVVLGWVRLVGSPGAGWAA